MTTPVIDTVAAPTPMRPWRKSRRVALETTVLVVLSCLVAGALEAVTGLDGILGLYVGFALTLPVLAFISMVKEGRNAAIDRFATSVLVVAFGAVSIPWISVITTVVRNGSKAFYRGYLTTDMLVTGSDDPLNMGGVAHALVGSALVVSIASVIAVPLGIVAAVYIVEVKGRFTGMVRFLTQAMSGVPSIVAGLFVYATVVTFFGGFSAWAGACALAVLMLPTVARTSEEVLKLVSDDLRAASYALGATQARTTFAVVLPTVFSGLITAAVLGVARVAGETAPLLLTTAYFVKTSTNLNEPIATMPIYVFQNLGIGTENSIARAWGGSLVLLTTVLLFFLFARAVSARISRK